MEYRNVLKIKGFPQHLARSIKRVCVSVETIITANKEQTNTEVQIDRGVYGDNSIPLRMLGKDNIKTISSIIFQYEYVQIVQRRRMSKNKNCYR